ncbi:MAG: hypothetical protein IT204_25745 [Fimbriimonadaceae bacterium]|nr:hypothetical protein [Fimbriimonadaceae bacterium]
MTRWLFVGFLAGCLTTGTPPARAAGEKSPAVAGVLGLVPGFGAGYWYAGNQRKGTAFAITDAALTIGLVAGMDGTFDNLFEPESDSWATVAAVCFYARLGSALYQCIDGATETSRANRRGTAGWTGASRPTFGWQLGSELFAQSPQWTVDPRTWDSRDGRELAAAWSRAQAAAPVWQLSATLPDAGLALSFNGRF